jgi:triacylglycerol esterase/lipase EstA (alpha/beta hydrolase family)
MKIAAEIVLAVILLTVFISFLFTTVTSVLRPLINRSDPAFAPEIRRKRLRAYLFELYAQSFFSMAYPTQLRTIPFRFRGTGRPIILVPGFISPVGAMYVLGRRLNRTTGRPVIGISHRPSMFSSIRTLAVRLSSLVEKETTESGQATVDLVGHSMGGLISRYYAEKLGGARRVRKLVLIGTPHRGARLANVAYGKCAREMEPGSEFLTELGQPPAEIVSTVEYASFGSVLDNVVQPGESAVPFAGTVPEGARVSHRWFGDTGHVGLVFHSQVARDVQTLLAEPAAGITPPR